MNKNIKKEILLSIINEFEKEEVRYCILRNYEFLPEKFGNDVDILTESSSSQKITEIIKKISVKYKWFLKQRGKKLYFILYENGSKELDFFCKKSMSSV